jgi:hypothetical protein
VLNDGTMDGWGGGSHARTDSNQSRWVREGNFNLAKSFKIYQKVLPASFACQKNAPSSLACLRW